MESQDQQRLAKLSAALERAAKQCGLPRVECASNGGEWQWVWYGDIDEKCGRQILAAGDPDDAGIQVSLTLMSWVRESPDKAIRRQLFATHLSDADLNEAAAVQSLSEQIVPALKKAWEELPTLQPQA